MRNRTKSTLKWKIQIRIPLIRNDIFLTMKLKRKKKNWVVAIKIGKYTHKLVSTSLSLSQTQTDIQTFIENKLWEWHDKEITFKKLKSYELPFHPVKYPQPYNVWTLFG